MSCRLGFYMESLFLGAFGIFLSTFGGVGRRISFLYQLNVIANDPDNMRFHSQTISLFSPQFSHRRRE